MPAPTPDEKKLKFREKYLQTGIISVACRYAEVHANTGTMLARECEADPEFVNAREALLARALQRGETMLMHALDVAAKRALKKPQTLTFENGATHIDTAPQYLRCLIDAHRALANRVKQDHDMKPENKGETGPVEVVIRMADTEKPDGSSG